MANVVQRSMKDKRAKHSKANGKPNYTARLKKKFKKLNHDYEIYKHTVRDHIGEKAYSEIVAKLKIINKFRREQGEFDARN